MPTLQECLKTRSSPFAIKKHQQTLHEGMELSAADLIDELTSTQVHSITATVVTDNAEALTILLQVKKWNSATRQATTERKHP
jgi:phage terminase small subunit